MINFTAAALNWLELLLTERFGQKIAIEQQESTSLVLHIPDCEGAIVFNRLNPAFHQSSSDISCTYWDADVESWQTIVEKTLPAPGEDKLSLPLIDRTEQGYVIHYDILGLVYWMLSRLEEVGRTDLDSHGRFPAISSHAYKHNYLERPIVDEWLYILAQVIQRLWPHLTLKKHQFSMKVSHDVDSPSLYAFKPWKTIARNMAGHLLKRRDLKAFVTAPYVKFATRQELLRADPYNTFDWLMDVSEANGLKSAFYFICGRTHPEYDAEYEPEHPAIRQLMRRIHQRGHEVGLHPSYATYKDPELIKQEFERLKRICAEEDIQQQQWGGRMHYLRLECPTTLRAWDSAGINYDSTLGYADRPGFRCGTCYEYLAFDPVKQEILKLRIRPLILMECTLIDKANLKLKVTSETADKIQELKTRCQEVSGCFTLLWHNSDVINSMGLYLKLADHA